MRWAKISDAYLMRGLNLPLTVPALMAIGYIVLVRIFMIWVFCGIRYSLDDRAIWPELLPICYGLTVVNAAWIVVLIVDGYGILTGWNRSRVPQLVGTSCALLLVILVEWSVLLLARYVG